NAFASGRCFAAVTAATFRPIRSWSYSSSLTTPFSCSSSCLAASCSVAEAVCASILSACSDFFPSFSSSPCAPTRSQPAAIARINRGMESASKYVVPRLRAVRGTWISKHECSESMTCKLLDKGFQVEHRRATGHGQGGHGYDQRRDAQTLEPALKHDFI